MLDAWCYYASMRTTLTLADHLARALKAEAARSGQSFKEVVNETLLRGLRGSAPKPRPYRIKTASLGGVRPGFNLDQSLRLAEQLEDEALAAKLEARK